MKLATDAYGAMDSDEEGVGKVTQPLVDYPTASSSGEASDSDSDDEEFGLLSGGPMSFERQRYEDAAARRKRRRRKEDEDLGEVQHRRSLSLSVKPERLLRAAAASFLSLWAAASVVAVTVRGIASPLTPTSSLPRSLTTQMLPRHKTESVEEMTERALVRLALLTVAMTLLLLSAVYWQNA